MGDRHLHDDPVDALDVVSVERYLGRKVPDV